MDPFFATLGSAVLARWEQASFALADFPEIARAALAERPPSQHLDVAAFVREFLLCDGQPLQTQSGFGQPELVVFHHARFYIQVLFWLDGTTDIHQHEFSGAFHVLAGSSIHAQFGFENAHARTPHLRVGDVRLRAIELLETGRTVPIVSGHTLIHSLFHLETPSITVVVRTHHDPDSGLQLNYLPPHVALDPTLTDTLAIRRRQLLDVLEQTHDPAFPELVLAMVAALDFERGFAVLQYSIGHLRSLQAEEIALAAFARKHGRLADGIAATLEEIARRDVIVGLRSTVAEPEHRFFLALLLNVPTRAELLTLVAQRFPDDAPVETVLRWAGELQAAGFGAGILDAELPDTLEIASDDQPEVFLAALRHFVEGGRTIPTTLRGLEATELDELRAAFTQSSLRPLLA